MYCTPPCDTPPGEVGPQAKSPYLRSTAQTRHLGPPEVGPWPKQVILAPDFLVYTSQGKLAPITFPTARTYHLGPLEVGLCGFMCIHIVFCKNIFFYGQYKSPREISNPSPVEPESNTKPGRFLFFDLGFVLLPKQLKLGCVLRVFPRLPCVRGSMGAFKAASFTPFCRPHAPS